ncbi:hypothetical protein JNW91_31510 [Micromonospora sp. STR1_7]|uniref:Uncharacterized protein n=1 Tax=Micromonospora parastrephiae TaxID=2806101 RepID=A0ABS1Y2Z0_9ACTN|nr:hypothetical protein [Micromonospora parastrephiae]MBM0235867.1 hypothetical protein [Micromonospora parastrephiae]
MDWSRSLLYLDVGGPGAGAERGLLQSVGPALVIRPDPAAVPTPAPPPLVPPVDRWRLHRLTPGTGLAPVLDLLLGLSADRPDPPPALGRWVARDTVAAGPVDVLAAPLPPRSLLPPRHLPPPRHRTARRRRATGSPATGSTRTPGCTSWSPTCPESARSR